MDILRKAFKNPNSVSFEPLKVDSKDLQSEINLDFLSKKYTNIQLLFYIVNTNLSYKEYLTKCKEKNILPVSYLDQKKLLDSLKIEDHIPFNNLERHKCIYDYTFIKNLNLNLSTYTILVSSAQNSTLNLKNIKKFLLKGIYTRKKIPLDEIVESFTFKNYLLVDSFVNTKNLVAVFLDGNDWQLKNCMYVNLHDLCENVAVFYVSEDESEFKKYVGYDVTCIKIENNKKVSVEMFRSLWNKIVSFEKKIKK